MESAFKIIILRTQLTLDCYSCSPGKDLQTAGFIHSRERKFLGMKVPGNECSRERMVPRTKVPSSWDDAFVSSFVLLSLQHQHPLPWSEVNWLYQERKFPGTFVPGSEGSQREPSLRGAKILGSKKSWYPELAMRIDVECRADVRAQAVVPLCPTLKYSIHLQYKTKFLIQRFTTTSSLSLTSSKVQSSMVEYHALVAYGHATWLSGHSNHWGLLWRRRVSQTGSPMLVVQQFRATVLWNHK